MRRASMRTIKFRGKRLDNGEWIYGSLLVIEDTYFIIEPADFSYDNDTDETAFWFDSTEQEVDPATVGEYTGFKDLHGKDIYEGDILTDEYGSIGEVEWVNGEFVVSFGDVEMYSLSNYFDGSCQMWTIGNIHDNPKLLEKE